MEIPHGPSKIKVGRGGGGGGGAEEAKLGM